jgi:THO complex subunit 6
MINSVVSSNDRIFSGCGDNNIYGFDMETHKQIMSLSEHNDYINCIILSNNSNLLYSGSEDGSVRVWDLRSHKESVLQINPFKNSDLSRPNYGKWIGALALSSDDWLICGGGPHLSLWHLNSMSAATKFDVDCTTNIVECHNDYIISGGNASNLYVWEMNGELRSSIPTSASDVFSIKTFEYKDNEIGVEQVISAAGMSHKIDICTNLKYKDFELFVI